MEIKRFLVLSVIFIAVMGCLCSVSYASDNNIDLVLCINESKAYVNNDEVEITQPMLVDDKTYIDLIQTAKIFEVELMEESGGIKLSYGEKEALLTEIKYWDDLKNMTDVFFKYNDLYYFPLRELAEFSDKGISYYDGIISVGSIDAREYSNYYTDRKIANSENINEYLFTSYPYEKEYVVNPYVKYSYENMLRDADKLKRIYPDLIETGSIGSSVEGRDLLLLKVGKGKNKIFVCGTHHAREYICTTYLMYAIDRYAYSYATTGVWNSYSTKSILDNVTFYIVPMVNPDGVNLVQNGVYATKNPEYIKSMSINEGSKYGYAAWKANVNGVDINWNYDKDWTYERTKGPRGSTGFNGYEPNSEPETVAMSNIVDSIPFEAFISFHTQGKLIYYCDDAENPTGLDKVLKAQTGFSVYYEKTTGVGGSFFDYVARKYRKTTMTFELCPYVGSYPYPDKNFDTVWKMTQNILLTVGNYYQYISY